MVEIGKYNDLEVVKETDFGVYLDGEAMGEILLPLRYVPNCEVGDKLEVFIYRDSEDRIIATTKEPYGIVGDFVLLKVLAVNKIGAFLDWGLMKDLLVPFREQKLKMEVGKSYIVYIYLDEETDRIVATSKIEKFLDEQPPEYNEEQEVDLQIYNKTDLGYRAIVDNKYWGVLYHNEVFQKLQRGQKMKGFIRKIREDGKIDVSLQKSGYGKIDSESKKILDYIKKEGGSINISDKSPANLIYNTFGISKKTFKKSVGALYKNRLILIEKDGIKLK